MVPRRSAHSCRRWCRTCPRESRGDNNSRSPGVSYPCFFQFVRIETIATTEVENLALQQIVLNEVSRGHREIRALDGREVRMVYLLWFHSYWGLRVRNPMLTAIWQRGEKVCGRRSGTARRTFASSPAGNKPKA